jgi:hypothetical protein
VAGIRRADVIELAEALGLFAPEEDSTRDLWQECLARSRSLVRERCTGHRWGPDHRCKLCHADADRLATTLPEVVLIQVARAAAGGGLLDRLPIEIGLWLEDVTKDHETIRAIGRLLGIAMDEGDVNDGTGAGAECGQIWFHWNGTLDRARSNL